MRREFTLDQLAWAAGLFEGEGTAHRPGGCVQLSLGSTDGDVIERLAQIVGGNISGPHHPDSFKSHWKPYWHWWASGEEAQEIAVLILPFMCARRTGQVASLLEWRRQRTRPAPCGTPSGYNRHRVDGEDACRECKDAVNASTKRQRHAREARLRGGAVTTFCTDPTR